MVVNSYRVRRRDTHSNAARANARTRASETLKRLIVNEELMVKVPLLKIFARNTADLVSPLYARDEI